MDLGLRGRSVLITGGSRGIGYACAQAFAEEGCSLHLVSRSQSDLDAARERLVASTGAKVEVIAADLTDRARLLDVAKSCAGVDILVNNAGSIPHGSLAQIDDARMRKAWELKLFGFINLTREFYAAMTARRSGVIVNVIGLAGERPQAGYIAGSTANAGLAAFTRALGAEAPDYGVRVFGVHPSGTETDRQVVRWRERAKEKFGDPERWRELTTGFPFGRLASAREVGDVVAFLASPRASYVSGVVLTIDGGLSMRK